MRGARAGDPPGKGLANRFAQALSPRARNRSFHVPRAAFALSPPAKVRSLFSLLRRECSTWAIIINFLAGTIKQKNGMVFGRG